MIVTNRLKRFDKKPTHIIPYITPQYSFDIINNKHIITKFIDNNLEWCANTFGQNDTLNIPEIEFEWDAGELRTSGLRGLYDMDENLITIRIRGHKTFCNLSKTIIHEYVHYLQPRVGNWYDRHLRRYGYENNPYEIEAYYIANLYGRECAQFCILQV